MITVVPEAASPEVVAVSIKVFPEHIRRQALEAVSRFSILTAAAPIIPIPLLDSVTVSALQLAMISELTELYGQEFSKNVASSLVGAAGGGLLSLLFSSTGPGRAIKQLVVAIPLVGPLLRYGAGPVALAGYTYLLGMAFIQHFETGGSFESFDRKQFANYVNRTVKERWSGHP